MTTLQLDGEQTIYEVADTHSQLETVLQDSQALCINLAGIEECDTAFLQLLLRAQRIRRQHNHQLTLLNPAPCVTRLASQLGLSDELTFQHEEVSDES